MPLLLYLCLVTLTASYCPNGYTYYESTQKCYKIVEEPSTYFAAADACTLDDGQLVSIHNAFENTYVTSLIPNKYADHWIGLTSMIMGWNFTWLDNSVFSYDRFSPSPPNRDYNCVVMKAVSSNWATTSCNVQLPFVCIYDPSANRTCPACPPPSPCPTCPSPPVCSDSVAPLNVAPGRRMGTIKEKASFVHELDVLCPLGYTYVDIMQRCYKVANDTKTFFAASNACNLDGAELVSIHSLEEGQAVGALLPLQDDDRSYWIGLTNLIDNWGQWTWLDDTSVRYANWADGRPENNFSCTVLHSMGFQWTTQTCQLLQPYICEFSPTIIHNCLPCPTPIPCMVCPTYAPCPPPKCDHGWIYSDYTDSCYFIGKQGNLNTSQAMDACIAKSSHLTSIHSDVENSFILNAVYSVTPGNAWIGLYRTGPNATNFENYDGTPIDYTKWSTGQPDNYRGNQYCTIMLIHSSVGPDGYWDDTACDSYLGRPSYVCKKPSNK